MAVSIIGPKFYAWDSDTGKPLAFGKVYTYQAGTNTPKATFTSEGGETQNANPVILNGAGYADIYLNGSYKVVVKDADDVEVWTSDPVSDPSQLQQEWVRQRSVTQVNPTTFTVDGELTGEYVEGVAVRVKQDSGFVFGTVVSATYADGKTTVELSMLDGATISSTAQYAERNIVSAFSSFGSDLIAHTGTPDTVTEALNKRPVAVDSIADLLALPEGHRKEGMRYLVRGYHAGSAIGGGVFSWSPTEPRSGHNGGTIISPSVAWNGTEATFEAFVLATDTSGLTGCFVREGYNILDVDFFGPFKSATSDDSPALDAFAKALALTPISAQLIGSFYPSRSIQIIGASDRSFFTDLRLFPKASVVEDVITFVDCWAMHQIGRIGITGHGGVNFTSRTARHGLVVKGNNSGSTFDKINVHYVRGDGVVNEGINAMGGFNHIRAWNCGASPQGTVQKVSINFSAVVNAGGSGDPTQTSTLTVSGFDTSKILPYAYLAYQSELYKIQSVTGNSITVSPFLPLGTTSGVVTLVQGAGLRNLGADTSKTRVGTLDSLVCGFGLQDLALYPATIQNIVTQYCGAGALISSIGDASIGSTIVSGYFEFNVLDWVKATVSTTFSATVGLSVTLNPEKIKCIGARHASIADYNYFTNVGGASITLSEDPYYTPKTYSAVDNPEISSVLVADAPTIPIEIADWKILLFNHQINTYTIHGTGAAGQPTGDVTLTVPAGFTINGSAGPMVISGSTKPVRVTVKRIRSEYYPPGTNYVVTYENT